MNSKWSDSDALSFETRYGEVFGKDLALRTYTSRLLGSEPGLVLHGGGNTSVKGLHQNVLGEALDVIYVKASGFDLATIEPGGHTAVDLSYLRRLQVLDALSDDEMVREIRSNLLDYRSATPSIETLVHSFIPKKFIDHTHADAVLALTNQVGGEELVLEALGGEVIVIEYVKPGFSLAKVMGAAFEAYPESRGAVWMLHGIMTWGDTARESYETMIELVSRAEDFVKARKKRSLTLTVNTDVGDARKRWQQLAPFVRGVLSEPTGDQDCPYAPVILTPLITRESLDFVDSREGKDLASSAPLTSDHLIRTKPYPLWVDGLDWSSSENWRAVLVESVSQYRRDYRDYIERNRTDLESGLQEFSAAPRVVLIPGIGAVCAGPNIEEAAICSDITGQTLAVKADVAAMGKYQGMCERDLFAMEYRGLQHAKLRKSREPLEGRVAIVTGAAGAIGSGICRGLLEQGCHVAATDLGGDALEKLGLELAKNYGDRVAAIPVDVTDQESVRQGFLSIAGKWGGVDLVIVNAGVALVSSLADMKLDAFQRLERVNIEGTLLMLSEAARHLKEQAIGGDIILVSTKNVFAPGAKFGAYSATKAGAHQLARIASLELAGIGVRVNMVSPDAVFEEGSRKSGLWAEVGPDRMRARGLDEKQLQEYYQSRNLLKARITAEHVSNAILYFATRQSPTTGSTIPVDGGLPDATPR